MLTIFLQAQQQEGGGSMMMVMMLVMIVGFYFLMIRPQMRKQKLEKKFQENIKPGTRVVMTSGLHGKIVQVVDDGVIIETMAGKQKFEKAAISREFTEARFGANKKENNKDAGGYNKSEKKETKAKEITETPDSKNDNVTVSDESKN